MRLKWRRGGSGARGPCVVFVVQWLETFEMVKPVVRALRDCEFAVKIVVTPERDVLAHWSSGDSYNLDAVVPMWKWLAANGFDPEPLVPVEKEADRLRALRPAAVFLPSPYDGIRHESLYPSTLSLPVHYVNYMFNICPSAFGLMYELPFFRECSALYAESEYTAEQFVKNGVDPACIVRSGSPILDHWDTERSCAEIPTILWCPWWSTHWTSGGVGYSTFIHTYRDFLDEVARRPHMRFIFRPHPSLWGELRKEALWTDQEERDFHARAGELENFTVVGEVTPTKRYAFYPDHLEQFEQAWAMVTDGVSFLAEFGYTGKPLLLTQAPGNAGWNPVGQAIAEVVERSDGIKKLSWFLDRVERGIDPDAERRRNVIRRQFYRPKGGSAAAIASHIAGL